MPDARILIADDDTNVRNILRLWLAQDGWTVETARNGRETLERLCSGPFDLAVLDLKMPYFNALEILQAVREQNIRTDVVVLTGYGTVDTAVRAMKLGAVEFIRKPMVKDAFVATIRKLVEERHPSPHVLAERLEAYVQDHADDPTLRFNDLRNHFKISMSYACKLFSEHIGRSFRQCLSYHRVQKAKQLIETTDDPMYTVAERCGFKNQQRLRDAFFRLEGIPPRKYREICGDGR